MKPYFTGRSILLGLLFSITGVFAYGTDNPGIRDADKPAPRTTGKPYQRPLPARAFPVNPLTALTDKLAPLPMRPIRPYPIPWKKPIELTALDPIRFTMKADRDTVRIGEELTLTIRAEVLNLPPTVAFTFDESYAFRLKVVMPDGFEQTGGDYVDYIQGQLDRWQPGQHVEFKLRGVFWTRPVNACFKLLRGAKNVTSNGVFVKKAERCFPINLESEVFYSIKKKHIRIDTTLKTVQQGQAINSGSYISSARIVNCNSIEADVIFGNVPGTIVKLYKYSSPDIGNFYGEVQTVINTPVSFSNLPEGTYRVSVCDECYLGSGNSGVFFANDLIISSDPSIQPPNWQPTGVTNCLGTDVQIEEVDVNPCSNSNPRTRWKTLSSTSAPAVYKNGNNTFCAGNQLELYVLGVNYTAYQWSNGATTSSITVTNSGQYWVRVRRDIGCGQSDWSERTGSISVTVFSSQPNWQNTGNWQCNGNTSEKEQKDLNECSSTFNQTRWVLLDPCGCNNRQPNWQDTGNTRCNGTSPEKEQRDNNSCSPTANNTQWLATGTCECYNTKPTLSGNDNGCGSVQLSITGISFSSVRWYLNGNQLGETGATINATQSGTYKVKGVSGQGCESPLSDERFITVNQRPGTPPKPGVMLEGSATFCQGQSAVLWAPDNQATYEWRHNGAVVSTQRNLSVTQGGLYAVRVKTQNDCGQSDWSPESDSFSIIVNDRPAAPGQPGIEILGQTTFCQGGNVIFNAPENQAAYEWRRDGNVVHTGRTLTTGEAGLYTVRVKTQNGCGQSDWSPESNTMSVTVNQRPPAPGKPNVSLEGTHPFCQGQSVVLWAPDNQATYEWRHNGTVLPATQRNLSVTQAGLYTVRVKTQNGCGQSDWSAESDGFPITVNNRPATPGAPNVDVLGSTNLCQGQSVILNAPENQAAYEWLRNGVAVATNRTLTVTESGLYTVRVKTQNGCGQSDWSPQSATTSVSVTSYPTVSATSNSPASQVRVGETLNLTATATGATSYNWTGPNGFTSTQQNPSLTNVALAASGSYTITASTNGCTATSTTEVTVGVADSPCGQVITKIRFMPRLDCPECMSRFAGGYFEASNDSIQWQRLADITAQPAPDWNEYTVTSPTAWRYVRYVASANSYGEAAGIEFWSGATKLTGRIFASGSLGPAYVPNYAFDDQTNTFWHGTDPRSPVPQNFIGLNIQKNIITAVGSNSPASQVKVGETLNLTVTAVGGASFSWSGPNGFTSTQQNPSIASVTAAAAGTYTVTATAQGCTATATTTVQLATCALKFSGLPQLTCDSLQRQGKVKVVTSGNRTGYKTQYRLQRLQLEGGNYVPDSTGGWVEVDTFPKLRAARYRFFIREVSLTAPADTLCAKDTTLDVSCGKQRRARVHAGACGVPYQADLSNTRFLQTLIPGDTVYTSDFDVIVTRVTGGGNGRFNAFGVMQVPLLGGTNVLVKLDNATFNDDYDLVDGYVESSYDPSWSNVVNVGAFVKDAVQLVQDVGQALADMTKLGITDPAERLDKLAKQFRDAAAKEMPQALQDEVETAIKEMKAAQQAYKNATTPEQKAAAQQAYDAAKAKLAAAKQKQEDFLDEYENIIKLALTAIKNDATAQSPTATSNLNAAATALQLPGGTATPLSEKAVLLEEAPLAKQTWIPATEVNKVNTYYAKEIVYNQTFLNLYFSQALENGGPEIKKLAKELRKNAKALGQYIYDETHKAPPTDQAVLVDSVKQSIITHLESLLKSQVYRKK